MMIRLYRDADLPAVLDIYAKSKLDEFAYEDQQFELLPLDQDPKRYTSLITSQISVYEEEKMLAYAAQDGADLRSLFVHPQGRGKGIGRTLMQHMLEKAEGEATLYVAKSNLPAKRLYEQFGFVITSEFMTDYNGIPILANKMVRKAEG
ncbi:GNAT family N-acetyltransferase [Pseudovibrio sp. Ad5]|uniref:GNAT family N-acetyltransferase n=1 Tax=Pseudovibrio sp. Ad5 TaxID=989436 RepID=UPI0007AE9B94|nr:GNAT family N-acetyltransferase [Pseudovibrio sp. Ad5]